jgi:hypothetical protein
MEILKQIIIWCWAHKEVSIIILLLFIVALQTKRFNDKQEELDKQRIERGTLPDNIEFIAELKGTKFGITYRDSKNNIVHKDYFIPKEGGLKFTKFVDLKQYDANSGFNGAVVNGPKVPSITNPIGAFLGGIFGPKNENKKNGESDIIVKWYGWTFRPGIAAAYNGGKTNPPISIALDAKLFFADRYSAGLGSTLDYPYIWAGRHVDDFIPFIPVENLEIMGGYGKPYNNFGDSVFTIGGRTNF